MDGLVGRKLGMTRIINEEGIMIAVTMIEILPHYVTQVKNKEKDGYCAVQVTTGNTRDKCLNKPKLGHLKKLGINYGKGLWEFRLNDSNRLISVGDIFTLKVLKCINKVDVTGISKGKGFAGAVKRWNFRTQDASHGNSLSHRAPGSIGQNQTPGKVFKGKKMAGHLGYEKATIQNLAVINIDIKNNLLLVKGAIPGVIGENVIVKRSVKIGYFKEMSSI
ncbi:50S ribosomal subunit protein L3 [Candidatus Blochmanniella floridana]|uniref:Large ribosomal subunit protein uL3 n=1 Tax=Blochmanniella floridana TaxID=203907 RepID=RL3_BLOFL|nr:RecName: Full=Large ribosomal subunit protein uL3; AltName: Full=50S ribosomal protein L3 [Candidatus Blochmannia floridanus]CAD83706.1 50S ribosomal subunit protein L3 [Candidatus Blochmannia floridanus]